MLSLYTSANISAITSQVMRIEEAQIETPSFLLGERICMRDRAEYGAYVTI